MKLDTKNWQPFKVGELFYKLENGKANQTMLEEGEDCFYVGAKRSENGVMFRCAYNESLVQKGNCIIFICNGEGSVGYANYMSMDFIGTTDIVAGYNENINEYTGPFIATVASLERPKFSYGRKWKKFLKNTELYLPVDGSGNPDWQFMETYIKSLHHKPLTTASKRPLTPKLEVDLWTKFALEDIFVLKGGFYNKKPEHSKAGKIPFLASTECNNGVTELYDISDIEGWDKVGNVDCTLDKKMYEGNSIAVTVNGSVCNAFYQSEPFTCSHDITVLYLKQYKLNVYIAMFLCTIIEQDKCKWSYGRKPHDVKKFGKSVIKLPSTPEGEPDWQFMEDYIKSLPYGDRIK